jgi:cytochrome c553
MEKHFKPGELFNRFQEKKRKSEEKHRKTTPSKYMLNGGNILTPGGGGSTNPYRGYNNDVKSTIEFAPGVPRYKKHMKMCSKCHSKSHTTRQHMKEAKRRKEHSPETMRGMEKFASEEAKEKRNRKHEKHYKKHSEEAIKGLESFARDEAKEKRTKRKNWIQGAIKNPGSLRASLGAKEGHNIPKSTLTKAAGKSGVTGKRARLAETLKGFHHKAHSSEAIKGLREFIGEEGKEKMKATHLKMYKHYKKIAEEHRKIAEL